jgi:hypothetical protein
VGEKAAPVSTMASCRKQYAITSLLPSLREREKLDYGNSNISCKISSEEVL